MIVEKFRIFININLQTKYFHKIAFFQYYFNYSNLSHCGNKFNIFICSAYKAKHTKYSDFHILMKKIINL